jgi:hypothetical protein
MHIRFYKWEIHWQLPPKNEYGVSICPDISAQMGNIPTNFSRLLIATQSLTGEGRGEGESGAL